MILSYKSLPTSTKDVDTKARMVRVVLSQMGNIDLDNDVIDHGAFDKTIMERGPKGADLIYHLADHYPSLKYAIGKFSDLSEQFQFNQKVHSRHLFAIASSYVFEGTTVFTVSEESGRLHIFEKGRIIYST